MKMIIINASKIVIQDYNHSKNFCTPKTFYKKEYLGNIIGILRAFCNSEDLLFSIPEVSMKLDFRYKQLVTDGTMFITTEWVYSYPKPSHRLAKTRWFKVNLDEGIMEIIDGLDFRCAILEKGNDIKAAPYVLDSKESIDFNILVINNKSGEDFFNIVLPRLKELLGDKLIVEDMRPLIVEQVK